ncbi:Polyketide cyclase/dehydrase [Croceitalea dokdonensis DOKDO 023]|uniref:Polyketide cyclase/dehydrase n=1 Tax=Croceitalea dokdonensis DOKDO 023 TaxID=1300341 RepID=A0A0P7B2N0_9FLAO|nr:Polyketide cyclase/dehydrase [Croceitalea dokdonensis DOKDO 023]
MDGDVGSMGYWLGNKDVGDGEQEITSIGDGHRIEGQLHFR